MTLIAVLDYGIGNLRSAQKALQHVGADARLTADPELIAPRGRRRAARRGLLRPLHGGAAGQRPRPVVPDEAIDADRPFLGICIGMQMLYEGSEEPPTMPRVSACCPAGSAGCPTG